MLLSIVFLLFRGEGLVVWSLNDAPVFVAIVECGGISAAADRLEISKSAVSKALVRLEEALGVRLSERNSRNFRITDAGQLFYKHALEVVYRGDQALAAMSELAATPMGKMVVALPMAFGREIFAPQLHRFCQQYPKIDLEIILSSHIPDIIRDNIDVAVVVGTPVDSELVIRRLYRSRLILVTSPQYLSQLHGEEDPEVLASHIRICEKRYAITRIPMRWRGREGVFQVPSSVVRINDPAVVRDAVINGGGVALVPDQYCRQAIAAGELVRVLPDLEMSPDVATVSAIYPSKHLASSKTRAMLEFLQEICTDI